MSVPILLVTGFLGAGKTTLINHLLAEPQGRRLAVLVNDFGAINIDAALLAGAADGVVALQNGCICCSLQGDLLRSLSVVLRRDPPPDAIVIETSGVSDPSEIVRALLDPVIFQAAALDAVICLADARHLRDRPALFDDALCRAQFRAADFIALNKTDLVDDAERVALRGRLAAFKPQRMIFELQHSHMPQELLFGAALHHAAVTPARPAAFAAPAFDSLSWTSPVPLSLPRFQSAIGQLAGHLVRAKGILQFAEQPGRVLAFQLVGQRATLASAPPQPPGAEPARIVLIGEQGRLDAARARALLASCQVGSAVASDV
jgi:cobalamin biosynthesis protein CobW